MTVKMMEGLLPWIREYRHDGLGMVGETNGSDGNRVLAGGVDGGDVGGRDVKEAERSETAEEIPVVCDEMSGISQPKAKNRWM